MLQKSGVALRSTRSYRGQLLQARLPSDAIYRLDAQECDANHVPADVVRLGTGRR